MSDPGQCETCHKKIPDPAVDDYTTVTFTDGIVALCSGCHEDAHFRDEHPVEIKPESEIPDELHLDSYFTMTCVTCHAPHGEHEADTRYLPAGFMEYVSSFLSGQERFPTRFLRKPNVHGELCLSCHRGGVGVGDAVEFAADLLPEYIGSTACRECHPATWEAWSKTLHARNYRDAKAEPEAILGDFVENPPDFSRDDIRETVGAHWAQRYIIEGKRGLMVRPEQWSINSGEWSKSGSFSRPWVRYCAGCHTTALNPYDGAYTERGTGCEWCHGPGLKHAESTDQFDIINPVLLAPQRRHMICEACHTSGHDRTGRFRYPVGFRPGEDLMSYYKGLVPKAGQGTGSFTGDGSYEDRRRQFLYWSSRINIMQGASCDICTTTAHERPEADDGDELPSEYVLAPNEACGTCHGEIAAEAEDHAGHGPDQAGCLDCHPPSLTVARDAYSIHDHKFQFAEPEEWMKEEVARCERCHPGRGDGREEASL